MNHSWVRGESVQWGAMGLSHSAAATPFRCTVCGVQFTHFYHVEPNIYAAMAAEGIENDKCPGPQNAAIRTAAKIEAQDE